MRNVPTGISISIAFVVVLLSPLVNFSPYVVDLAFLISDLLLDVGFGRRGRDRGRDRGRERSPAFRAKARSPLANWFSALRAKARDNCIAVRAGHCYSPLLAGFLCKCYFRGRFRSVLIPITTQKLSSCCDTLRGLSGESPASFYSPQTTSQI